MNHDIHHDMYAVYRATQDGRSPQDPEMTAYERAAESRADRAGAYLCAKAGFNPWGMIWTFRGYNRVAAASSSGGSDHPSDAQREADLAALFRSDKATFGKFHDNIARATPLAWPQVAQRQGSPYPQYPRPPQYSQPYSPYPQQSYSQYPQQPYAQYPQPPHSHYPQQPYAQYPQQPYSQYPEQQQQYPPPPPPCYPGC